MYHIEKLRSKEIAELQSIAQELGIKGIKSLDRDSLIYRILDGQAMQNSQTGAPAVVKEENRMNRRGRDLGIEQIFASYSNPKGNADTERVIRTDRKSVV